MITLLSAVLTVLAFPHWDQGYLIFFALAPLFYSFSIQKNARGAVIHGLGFAFAMTMGGFYWVAHSLQHYGGLPVFISILGLIFFGFICQPQIPVFAWIFFHYTKKRKTSADYPFVFLLALALLYTGIDWIMPKLFQDSFGHSQYLNRYMRQGADIGGVHFLTFLIVLWNLALWVFFKWKSWRPLLASGLLLLANLGYGWYRENQITQMLNQNPPRVTLAAIQANIGDFDKIAAEKGVREAAFKVLESYLKLSQQALTLTPKPQAIIWPETAYPSVFRQPRTAAELERDQGVEKFVRQSQTPLLFGGYDTDTRSKQDSNAFFFLHPRPIPMNQGPEQDLRIYKKNVLLMFGEYIPGAEWIPQFKTWFPQVGYFLRGPGPEVLDIKTGDPQFPTLKVGPIICYEALFPNYVIMAARQGSQLILNITNDSWFGKYGEPYLHFALTVFRGIETRLPQLRATNTGISALVLPDGEIIQKTGVFEETIFNVQVPILPKMQTLVLLLGDWFGYFALGVGFLLLEYLKNPAQRTSLNPQKNR